MPPLPESMHTTARKIYEWYEAKKEDHREHLGASLIGHSCDRYLWLTFRWAASPEFGGRLLRLFDTGKREEARIHEELRGIGVELHTEEGGSQITCRDDTGHFGGSIDGIGLGFPEGPKTWAVLEIKTFNAANFAKLKASGVETEKPQHYAQMQAYMGLLKLDRTMYIAVNKDTDDLHTEWVHFSKTTFRDLTDRAERTVKRTTPADRISSDPSNWQCKMCNMYKLCHQGQQPERNCRTCCHATPVAAGKWNCELHGKGLTAAEQRVGCDGHLLIPALMPGAEAIDGGVNSITYRDTTTGNTFTDGPTLKVRRRTSITKKEAKSAEKFNAPFVDPFNDDIPF